MKVLHIMPANLGTVYNFIGIIEEKNGTIQHDFLLTNTSISVMKNNTKLLNYPSLQYVVGSENGKGKVKRFADMYIKMKNYDRVLWHSFIPLRGNYAFLLFLSRKLRAKSSWIEWGEDLYYPTQPAHRLKRAIKNVIMKTVKKELHSTGVTMPTDEETVRLYNRDMYCQFLRYPLDKKNVQILEHEKIDKQDRMDRPIGIQIGMSGHKWNNHIHWLDKISAYKNDEIQIYIPVEFALKYYYYKPADEVYIATVRTNAKQTFNNKVTFFKNRNLTMQGMIHYLNQIDMLIIDEIEAHEYEYTIMYLVVALSMGKRVFMSNDSKMLKYLREKELQVYSTDELKGKTIQELLDMDVSENKKNRFLQRYYDEESIIDEWNAFISY